MNDAEGSAALDESSLRKAWLRRQFGSIKYRRYLLEIHRQWVGEIRRALHRAHADDERRQGESHPTDVWVSSKFQGPKLRRTASEHFGIVVLPNLESIPTPETCTEEVWRAHPGGGGEFRQILDYGSNIMLDDYWIWMTPEERKSAFDTWRRMQQMCSNIRRTVDQTWNKTNDDVLLDEAYTGPISWPADWKRQLLGDAATLLDAQAAVHVKAGERVEKAGTYQALDPRDRRFRVGEGDRLPDLGSAYGATVWQRIGD